jgi:hypothetical protein
VTGYNDASLDNARHEIESVGKQISDLSPLAISLTDKDNSHDDVVNNILSVNDRIEWDSQFQELIKKLLVAQNRYIQLLEKELKSIKA